MKRVEVQSSAIGAIEYDARRRRMGIAFQDSRQVYIHYDVPVSEFEAFLAADSKASKTVQPSMATPMLALGRSAGSRSARRMVVYRKPRGGGAFTGLAQGAQAFTLEQFVAEINA